MVMLSMVASTLAAGAEVSAAAAAALSMADAGVSKKFCGLKQARAPRLSNS